MKINYYFKRIAALAMVAVVPWLSACNNKETAGANYEVTLESLPAEVQKWEELAEAGDTAAMDSLLIYYDGHCYELMEVVQVLSPDREDITEEWREEQAALGGALNDFCHERLEYWLDKGLAIDDMVAVHIKGMRLYYGDEQAAVEYLSRSAEAGNGEAALYCGSAYYNLDNVSEAIKYLTMADERGVPSAGWHLAQCYISTSMKDGVRDADDLKKALEYLRRSALLDCPEAVLEMDRLEPENPLWQQKIDSLEIDFPPFPIFPDE